jgi:hypothetical protein
MRKGALLSGLSVLLFVVSFIFSIVEAYWVRGPGKSWWGADACSFWSYLAACLSFFGSVVCGVIAGCVFFCGKREGA